MIYSSIHPSSKYLLNTLIPKPEELGSWNFETMFIPLYVSCVTCHMSRVMCHVSCVTCHVSPVTGHGAHVIFYLFFFLTKKSIKKKLDNVVELVDGGSVINGPTSSSLRASHFASTLNSLTLYLWSISSGHLLLHKICNHTHRGYSKYLIPIHLKSSKLSI